MLSTILSSIGPMLRALAVRRCHTPLREESDSQDLETLKLLCDIQNVNLYDFRTVKRTKKQSRGLPRGTRPLSDISALYIHQTAAVIKRPETCLSIPAHGCVLDDGSIVLLQPMSAYMEHAGAANRKSIGIEISAYAAGIEGDMRTVWVSRRNKRKGVRPEDLVHEVNEVQIASAISLCSFYYHSLLAQLAKNDDKPYQGGFSRHKGLLEVSNHRNSSLSRTADPGSRIHQTITYRVSRLLNLECGIVCGTGRPNPTAWVGEGTIPYSWRVRGY